MCWMLSVHAEHPPYRISSTAARAGELHCSVLRNSSTNQTWWSAGRCSGTFGGRSTRLTAPPAKRRRGSGVKRGQTARFGRACRIATWMRGCGDGRAQRVAAGVRIWRPAIGAFRAGLPLAALAGPSTQQQSTAAVDDSVSRLYCRLSAQNGVFHLSCSQYIAEHSARELVLCQQASCC